MFVFFRQEREKVEGKNRFPQRLFERRQKWTRHDHRHHSQEPQELGWRGIYYIDPADLHYSLFKRNPLEETWGWNSWKFKKFLNNYWGWNPPKFKKLSGLSSNWAINKKSRLKSLKNWEIQNQVNFKKLFRLKSA